jgi:flagellar operon protein (TIGR03826 family)
MPIANCKRCGRIFNRVRRDICPVCVAEEDQAFEKVRAYLRQHRYASLPETSEATGVDIDLITEMIKSGRLILRDNPNFTYACERCGAPTQVGRYCQACSTELSRMYARARDELQGEQPDAEERRRLEGRYYSR